MNTQKILAQLEKVPLILLLVGYLGWVGYDYYFDFRQDPGSPLVQKKGQLETLSKDTVTLADKIKKGKEFYKTLDQKRADIRNLSLQLEQLKATLSEDLDLPSFMRLVTTEADKVGVQVLKISPGEPTRTEFTQGQSYTLDFRAVYVQLLVFLQRLSNLERIIRVETFNFHPISSKAQSSYIELEGQMQVRTYQYVGSQADAIGNSAAAAAKVGGGK